MNIFVGNLDFKVDEIELIKMFALYGDISTVKLIRDRDTGKSRGFGFIEMPKESDAQRAIESLNGKEIFGRPIVVHESKPADELPPKKPQGGFNRSGPPGGRKPGYGDQRGRYDRDRPQGGDQRPPRRDDRGFTPRPPRDDFRRNDS
jgi:RNA recognition motif-containing protein